MKKHLWSHRIAKRKSFLWNLYQGFFLLFCYLREHSACWIYIAHLENGIKDSFLLAAGGNIKFFLLFWGSELACSCHDIKNLDSRYSNFDWLFASTIKSGMKASLSAEKTRVNQAPRLKVQVFLLLACNFPVYWKSNCLRLHTWLLLAILSVLQEFVPPSHWSWRRRSHQLQRRGWDWYCL